MYYQEIYLILLSINATSFSYFATENGTFNSLLKGYAREGEDNFVLIIYLYVTSFVC